MLLGQRRRGARIMIALLGLVFAGLLIGGLDAVDSQRDEYWYMAQFGAGPIVIVADMLNQQLIRSLPESEQYASIGLGHINAIGTLYVALAGLMNIVAVLDVFRDRTGEQPKRRADDRTAKVGEPAQ